MLEFWLLVFHTRWCWLTTLWCRVSLIHQFRFEESIKWLSMDTKLWECRMECFFHLFDVCEIIGAPFFYFSKHIVPQVWCAWWLCYHLSSTQRLLSLSNRICWSKSRLYQWHDARCCKTCWNLPKRHCFRTLREGESSHSTMFWEIKTFLMRRQDFGISVENVD